MNTIDILLTRFEVDQTGMVKRLSDGKLWPGYKYPTGYYMIEVTIAGIKYREYVHRIVATIYLPNNQALPEVNHIDGNKANNNVKNLEWCTHQQNMKHANTDKQLRDASKTFKSVRCVELDMTFESVKAANIYLGKNPRSPLISYACKGRCSANKCETAYGYHWEHVK